MTETKNLYNPENVQEIKQRIGQLRTDSPRQWGTMNPAQAVAHCSCALQLASGEITPRPLFLGSIMGRLIKPLVFRDNTPIRQNAPTVEELRIQNDPDLAAEQQRLCSLVDAFVAAGPAGCTDHPHSFFGRLTPRQWSILMYKHLDHHLRQFGV